ncbi:hypothetical protein EDC56_3236 [Sinobacterium caligoides]|uniref:Uncharacterized protein n=1 Tax=Sinobacterium caligoides TaxID=933926 RepID=A0A3N2DGR3_9GAMM|nr:hypothetical protein [Sinobacterium caligoides]ROR98996.1 hypothetical protein EDC56_3236 [Sinobacterium caligoides]
MNKQQIAVLTQRLEQSDIPDYQYELLIYLIESSTKEILKRITDNKNKTFEVYGSGVIYHDQDPKFGEVVEMYNIQYKETFMFLPYANFAAMINAILAGNTPPKAQPLNAVAEDRSDYEESSEEFGWQ